jgi:hypothetical protein
MGVGGVISMIPMFVFVSAFDDADRLTQEKVDFFAGLDCDNPNAISGFKWNLFATQSQQDQCKTYQTASKLLQLFRAMETSQNHSVLPGNGYHSDGLKFPDDAYN